MATEHHDHSNGSRRHPNPNQILMSSRDVQGDEEETTSRTTMNDMEGPLPQARSIEDPRSSHSRSGYIAQMVLVETTTDNGIKEEPTRSPRSPRRSTTTMIKEEGQRLAHRSLDCLVETTDHPEQPRSPDSTRVIEKTDTHKEHPRSPFATLFSGSSSSLSSFASLLPDPEDIECAPSYEDSLSMISPQSEAALKRDEVNQQSVVVTTARTCNIINMAGTVSSCGSPRSPRSPRRSRRRRHHFFRSKSRSHSPVKRSNRRKGDEDFEDWSEDDDEEAPSPLSSSSKQHCSAVPSKSNNNGRERCSIVPLLSVVAILGAITLSIMTILSCTFFAYSRSDSASSNNIFTYPAEHGTTMVTTTDAWIEDWIRTESVQETHYHYAPFHFVPEGGVGLFSYSMGNPDDDDDTKRWHSMVTTAASAEESMCFVYQDYIVKYQRWSNNYPSDTNEPSTEEEPTTKNNRTIDVWVVARFCSVIAPVLGILGLLQLGLVLFCPTTRLVTHYHGLSLDVTFLLASLLQLGTFAILFAYPSLSSVDHQAEWEPFCFGEGATRTCRLAMGAWFSLGAAGLYFLVAFCAIARQCITTTTHCRRTSTQRRKKKRCWGGFGVSNSGKVKKPMGDTTTDSDSSLSSANDVQSKNDNNEKQESVGQGSDFEVSSNIISSPRTKDNDTHTDKYATVIEVGDDVEDGAIDKLLLLQNVMCQGGRDRDGVTN